MSEVISDQQIRVLVKKAQLSPSGDNCQPWSFEWNGSTLSIFHLESRARHPLDPQGATSVLNLGCLLEAILIAASEIQAHASYTLGELVPGSAAPWAEVRFRPSMEPLDPLASSLEKRCTDRRLFQGGNLSATLFKDLVSSENKILNAELHRAAQFTSELIQYLLDSETKMVEHPSGLPAILNWVRFSKWHAMKTGDGLSWRNLMAKFWELPLIFLVRNRPWVLKMIRRIVMIQFRKRAKLQVESSAGLVCVSIPASGDDMINIIEAGRLMMRAWLCLNKEGYGVHPLTIASIPILYKKLGVLDNFFTKHVEYITRGERVLQKAFGISEQRIPIWMIRTGRSTPLPSNARTFRRPVEDILKFTKKQ
jgi:hypothetical protein